MSPPFCDYVLNNLLAALIFNMLISSRFQFLIVSLVLDNTIERLRVE
nr:MAG TPA: hypothetical protein [Caudoviricetes sp.]